MMIVGAALLLVVCFFFVGLTKATEIAGIGSMFIAVVSLVIVLWTGDKAQYADAQQNNRYPHEGIAPPETIARVARDPQRTGLLALSSVLLGAALCTLASVSLFRYASLWPWWAAVFASVFGFAAAFWEVRRDLASGTILMVNLFWAAAYSLILIQYRRTHAPSGLRHLELLCWAFMVLDILLLLALILPPLRTSNYFSAKLQVLLLICLALGMGLTATGFQTSTYSLDLFDFAGWALFVAVLVTLVNSVALALTSAREGS